MKERPILMKTEMVNAILDGHKTQTRRVIKLPADAYDVQYWSPPSGRSQPGYADPGVNYWTKSPSGNHIDPCPYGQVGDKLWVRETWATSYEGTQCQFKADGKQIMPPNNQWKPSIFMPHWASRITLTITDIRVQRVQDITENDARAEGVKEGFSMTSGGAIVPHTAKQSYKYLWDSINEKRDGGRKTHDKPHLAQKRIYAWDKNPFVWVISFSKEG